MFSGVIYTFLEALPLRFGRNAWMSFDSVAEAKIGRG
jgi:hypothetical protein